MKDILKKILKIYWLIKQPLTKKPSDSLAMVSDLFVWRRDEDWSTFFELVDLPALFGDDDEHFVNIIFFNQSGTKIYNHKVELFNLQKQMLNISKIIDQVGDTSKIGTFAVFHSKVPNNIIQSDSWITERGYVGYRYKNAPLSSYVHGNYDAIAKTINAFELLGGESFLNRVYQLQFLFLPKNNYEIILVNICSKVKKITIQVLSIKNGDIIDTQLSIVQPRVPFIVPIKNILEPCRVVIKSRIVMARPIIFSLHNNKGDVFHG